MDQIIKKYTNDEITIIWKPRLCTHVCYCWEELIEVFDPQKRPWVNPQGASTQRIIKQIERRPSGALTYYMNNKEVINNKREKEMETENTITVKATTNGPLIINHPVSVIKDDNTKEHPNGAAFCRCSKSNKQPYCDGSHAKNPFE